MRTKHTHTAQAYVAKQEKYNGVEPTAIELFKDTHCSSKTGFSDDVKKAIAQMETIIANPPEEGQVAKTPTEAVAEVLPKSTFLPNVGINPAATKRSAEVAEFAKQVVELQGELNAEKEESAAVRVEMDELKNQVVEEREATKKLELQVLEEREATKKLEGETSMLWKEVSDMRAFFRCIIGNDQQ